MPGSAPIGMLALVVAIAVLVLVGLIYFGGRRQGPPDGMNRDRR
ncbi:hypothetical protein [Actinomadura opuntiae]|nr:hypothetical protein [Actinomadura sp. OS1-43]MDL4817103.1 hypothetical protein [Actinomadura sp. OS1-43]